MFLTTIIIYCACRCILEHLGHQLTQNCPNSLTVNITGLFICYHSLILIFFVTFGEGAWISQSRNITKFPKKNCIFFVYPYNIYATKQFVQICNCWRICPLPREGGEVTKATITVENYLVTNVSLLKVSDLI